MNLQELQKQIINKQLNNIYIFTGEEIAVQKIYINKIAEINNLEIQYVEDFKSIYNKLNVNDIMNIKKLYVIIDDIEYTKQEKVWQEKINANGNILIFKFNELDKRSKFYKQFENDIVEFNKLSDEILIQYIQKETILNKENCKKLINICNSNYNQILLEIDKLKNWDYYIANGDVLPNDDNRFQLLEKFGAFHKEISDITFEFIEKVLKRDIKAAFDLQKKLRQIRRK